MAVRIRSLEDAAGAASAWDAFVQATPAASFFHLSPGAAVIRRADAADALAVAICHAHHRGTQRALARGYALS